MKSQEEQDEENRLSINFEKEGFIVRFIGFLVVGWGGGEQREGNRFGKGRLQNYFGYKVGFLRRVV